LLPLAGGESEPSRRRCYRDEAFDFDSLGLRLSPMVTGFQIE